MSSSLPLPGADGFPLRLFRDRIAVVLNIYLPVQDLLTTLNIARGVIIGSVANIIAMDTTPQAPTGLDLAVEYDGFRHLSGFIVGNGYEQSEDVVAAPWSSTAHSVYHFRILSRRRIGPSSITDYVRVVRLKPQRYALFLHLLKSPSTVSMTYLSSSTWLTFYPELWKNRQAWSRWGEVVNDHATDSERRVKKLGFDSLFTNEHNLTPCIDCPAANRLLTGGMGVYSVVHCQPRNRADTYGQKALNNFASVSIKWRFSVHCFNSCCPRHVHWAVRQPEVFFAPTSAECVEALSDELCMYKEAWVFRDTLLGFCLDLKHHPLSVATARRSVAKPKSQADIKPSQAE
ncbi:hypothetical protein K435DRAFT_803123 [Dendrothele bispora CBS 962.96]|uniref:Uncharacterized protein n=1 Tax=Dendrothele bispora (strain CBS 962.96) TaxID=1314807 RepID=A0A4S8LJ70_DENBC|nr:hypothetical protein K435DRAFT_803123 [Dendrothele bispora CBS 962.96]